MPRNLSLGCSSAKNTAWFALAPECGCTFANFAIKQLLGPVDGEALDPADESAAAIIAPPGIAFRVLVGEHRNPRLQHRLRDDVLGRDQLDLLLLPAEFVMDRRGDIGCPPAPSWLRKKRSRSAALPAAWVI